MTIFDETGSMHDNAKDDTLNKDQSYNTPHISLTDKTQDSIDEIRPQLKTLTISIEERLTFVENQLRETRNNSQPHTPVSINNRIDDTTHQPLVIDLLKTRITELEKQVADKNCIIDYLTKTC